MMIIGAFALVVGLTLYTLLDALRTHQDQMRTFPKWLWIIAVIFFPVVGPLLWLLLGRPRAVRAPKTQQGGGFTSSRRGTPPPATSSPD
ncbi:PLD nuclease N-terminal domain-containing protein, partial [Rothia dentocariosa]